MYIYFLQDPHYFGQGSTNGVFQDNQYFTCPEDNGLFVSMDRLSEDPSGPQIKPAAAAISAATPPPTGHQHYLPRSAQKDGGRRQKALSDPEAGSILPPSRKEGDRVVFFKKDGTPVSGTVRWTTPYTYQEGNKWFGFNAVWIETVSYADLC